MHLIDTKISQNVQIDSQGRFTITKDFYFEKDDPNESVLELPSTPGFPQRGAALAENSRYVMSGSVDISPPNSEERSIFRIVSAQYVFSSLDYSTNIDVNGDEITNDTPPWRLPPENLNWSYPEVVMPFDYGYDDQNQRTVRVCNGAGDRLLAETIKYLTQVNFTYNTREWDVNFGEQFGGVVNADYEYIAGIPFPPRTGLLKPPPVELVRTYDNDGSLKWEYYRVNISIIKNPEGWQRKLLNVGTRAYFINGDELGAPGVIAPEQIYMCRLKSGSNVIFSNLSDCIAAHEAGTISGYEAVTEPLPLYLNGHINYQALADPENNPYQELAFNEYKAYSWAALNIPAVRG